VAPAGFLVFLPFLGVSFPLPFKGLVDNGFHNSGCIFKARNSFSLPLFLFFFSGAFLALASCRPIPLIFCSLSFYNLTRSPPAKGPGGGGVLGLYQRVFVILLPSFWRFDTPLSAHPLSPPTHSDHSFLFGPDLLTFPIAQRGTYRRVNRLTGREISPLSPPLHPAPLASLLFSPFSFQRPPFTFISSVLNSIFVSFFVTCHSPAFLF